MKKDHRIAGAKGVIYLLLLLLVALIAGHGYGSAGQADSLAGSTRAQAIPVSVPMPHFATAGSIALTARAAPTPLPLPVAVDLAHRRPEEASRTKPVYAAALAVTLLRVCALLATVGLLRRWRRRRDRFPRVLAPTLLVLALTAGGMMPPTVAQASQSPTAYLTGAIDWLQATYVDSAAIDWPTLRRQALAFAHGARSTADTYQAIAYVLFQIGDHGTFFNTPNPANSLGPAGFWARYPGGRVFYVQPGSAADQAGIHSGDIILSINGQPVQRAAFSPYIDQPSADFTIVELRRADVAQPIDVFLNSETSSSYQTPSSGHLLHVGSRTIAYLDPGGANGQLPYPTQFQQLIRTMDQAGACGWVVDLQHVTSGDLWSYLAGLGPLLDPGVRGAFLYPTSGTLWKWSYHAGRVFWNGLERPEDGLGGPPYVLRHREPPIAVLTSRVTLSAAELLAGAFAEHPHTRSFGQPTAGSPHEETSTELSDGAYLVTSNAEALDAQGNPYSGPLVPDVTVATDWAASGTLDDPVLRAAVHWLGAQRGCSR